MLNIDKKAVKDYLYKIVKFWKYVQIIKGKKIEDILKVRSIYLFLSILKVIKNIKRFVLLFTLLHSFSAPNYRPPILTFRLSI